MTKKKRRKERDTRRKQVEKKPKSMSLAEKAIIVSLIAVFAVGTVYIAVNMYGSQPNSEKTPTQTPTETPSVKGTPEPTPPSTGEGLVLKDMGKAPTFTLESINGETVRLEDFHGKVVLLDFWATWCGPCRMSISELKRLSKDFLGEDFVIISVNLREDANKVKDFASTKGMTWIVLLDRDGEVADKYGVRAIPTFILIDKHGKIRLKITGLIPNFYETLSNAISQLLSEP